jgi:hypothetical protein
MIGHCIFQVESAEPSVNQIQVDFFAEPALRPNAEAVANNQHADHQLWIDRGAPIAL